MSEEVMPYICLYFRGLLLIVPSFVIVGLCSSMLQLYTGLGLYAVSTAFVVPCLTTLVAGYGETHQKVTTKIHKQDEVF